MTDRDRMMKCMRQGTHGDVKIHPLDGDPIKAHAAILRIASPVLDKMLGTDMKEKEEGVIKMNASSIVVNNLLDWIYLRQRNNLDNITIFQLLDVADMYEITELTKEWTSVLLRRHEFHDYPTYMKAPGYADAAEVITLCRARQLPEMASIRARYVLNLKSWYVRFPGQAMAVIKTLEKDDIVAVFSC
jgi:hypothetical protein